MEGSISVSDAYEPLVTVQKKNPYEISPQLVQQYYTLAFIHSDHQLCIVLVVEYTTHLNCDNNWKTTVIRTRANSSPGDAFARPSTVLN